MSKLTDFLGITNKKKAKKTVKKKPEKPKKGDKNFILPFLAPSEKPEKTVKNYEPSDVEKAEDEDLITLIKSRPKSECTPRELKFIKYHLLTLTKETAAIRAGYSKKSASQIASELLKKPRVQKELNKRIKAIVTRFDDKISKMIEHLYICAYYDPKDILDDEGEFVKPLKELGNLSYAVEGIETKINSKGYKTLHIKLANKKTARDQLGKYLQMFTDRVELTGKDGEPLPAVVMNLPEGCFTKKAE